MTPEQGSRGPVDDRGGLARRRGLVVGGASGIGRDVARTLSAADAELGPSGIRVNAVAPGYVRTGMTADLLGDAEAARRIEARISLGYIAEPADVAPCVRFLRSDEARYITGAVIPVEGGFSLGG